MTESRDLPDWLLQEVAAGLQRLILLALEGGPALESIEGVALAWADACLCWPIAWDEAQDAPRLRLAFRQLAASVKRFPSPVQLREVLPPRQAPPQLAPPEPNAALAARIQAEIRSVLENWK
jgi:hypothetical protein